VVIDMRQKSTKNETDLRENSEVWT